MTAKIIDLFFIQESYVYLLPLFMFLYITQILPLRFPHK